MSSYICPNTQNVKQQVWTLMPAVDPGWRSPISVGSSIVTNVGDVENGWGYARGTEYMRNLYLQLNFAMNLKLL